MTNISDTLYERIERLPKTVIFNLMLSALDEMQSYNGQSCGSAICRAMGAEEKENEEGRTYWKIPFDEDLLKSFS